MQILSRITLIIITLFSFCQAQEKQYNVLMILVDDLRPTLGVYGDKAAISPNLDKWSKNAMVFERAYSNQAVCVASRYNLLLGSRSTSTGLYDFGRAFRDFYPEATTLPELYKNNGYYTAAIGKVFHVGHNTYNDEQSWSVPHWHDKVIEYAEKGHDKETREEALFANKTWEYANQLEKGSAWEKLDVSDETYADGRVAQEAISRMDELKGNQKPFFLAVGFARPHLPFTVPKKYWDLYDKDKLPFPTIQSNPKHSPSWAVKRDGEISQYAQIPAAKDSDPFPASLTKDLIHGYYAGVSYVDVQIGKVLKHLQSTGLDKNTIVVIWGDHGYLLGEMGMWTKHVNYELANRIPLLIKHPDMKKAVHSKELIETVDIYPTLAALSGLKLTKIQQPIDGTSYANFIRSGKGSLKETIYHCFPRDGKLGRAIRDKDYRLIAWQTIQGNEEPQFELYQYKDGLIETENIWREDHPAFIKLKKVLEAQPKPLPMRPASKPRKH